MARQIDKLTVYRVANLYYNHKLKQEEIAKQENISRSQVSRLLERAIQLGIVTILVKLPTELDQTDLANALAIKLGLKQVIFSPVSGEFCKDSETARQVVAQTAAETLPILLKNNKNIGIGWGKTMYETSLNLAKQEDNNKKVFLPLLGASGVSTPCLQINNLLDRFCEKLGGASVFTSVLTIRESSVPLSPTEQHRVDNLHNLWHTMDAAVFGIGTVPQPNSDIMTEFSEEYLCNIRKNGFIGDILAQFFCPDGTRYRHEDCYTITACSLSRLKQVANTICVAGGEDKAPVLLAAAKNGFYKTLITDSHTGALMFSYIT